MGSPTIAVSLCIFNYLDLVTTFYVLYMHNVFLHKQLAYNKSLYDPKKYV